MQYTLKMLHNPLVCKYLIHHCDDVIMGAIASLITSLTHQDGKLQAISPIPSQENTQKHQIWPVSPNKNVATMRGNQQTMTGSWSEYISMAGIRSIMGKNTSQNTSLTIVYWTVYSDADQRKPQSSASLAFVWGIHRGPVNSPNKWPVTRKMFPFDDVIRSLPKTADLTCFTESKCQQDEENQDFDHKLTSSENGQDTSVC